MAPEIAMVDFMKFRIDLHKDVTLHNFVGAGAFAEVWKGTYNGKTVAVKILNKDKQSSSQTSRYNTQQKNRLMFLVLAIQWTRPILVSLRSVKRY